MKWLRGRVKRVQACGDAADWGGESLEARELLAANVTWPSLAPYIAAADKGINSGEATIHKMVSALEAQLTSGPLAGLQAGTLNPSTFQSDVAGVVSSFRSYVDGQLLPRFPTIDTILNLQATSIESQLSALDAQETAGLISSATETTKAGTTIQGLVSGPLKPLHTPPAGFTAATTALKTELNLLPPTLATGASPALTVGEVQSIAVADAQAYQNALAASLYTRPMVNQEAVVAINAFVTKVDNLSTSAGSAQSELTAAIAALDAALLDTTGLFGPHGPVARG